MGHHSYFEIVGHSFLYCRESYIPDVAVLFTEEDRLPIVDHVHDNGQPWSEFTYAATVTALRERLQVQGFTKPRAQKALAAALAQMNDEGAGSLPDPQVFEDGIRQLLAAEPVLLPSEKDDVSQASDEVLDELSRWRGSRDFVRLLLDCAPETEGAASLDLTQLTGCCVELGPSRRIAEQARAKQLVEITQTTPLLVLTEGTADAQLLSAGMSVTHPHLKGFVTFFDYVSSGTEGGVAQLARNVASFVAAGVATGTVQARLRDLPSRVVVYLLLAACLFPETGYPGVWRKLTGALAGLSVAVPSASALAQARRRIGAAPLRWLFDLLKGPGADVRARGTRWRGLLVVALDGTTLTVPDSPAVLTRFTKQAGNHGGTGYPQVRLLALVACGTRTLIDAVFGPTTAGETTYAPRLLPSLRPGMILLADRNFATHKLVAGIAATKADVLVRL